MQKLMLVLIPLALAGCAGTAAPLGFEPPARGVPKSVLAAKGALRYEEALKRFGPPDVARREGKGGLLSYRLPGCALALAFVEDANGVLRLAEVEAGPPQQGAPAPTVEACFAAAEARR